jgi:hypothetical protein
MYKDEECNEQGLDETSDDAEDEDEEPSARSPTQQFNSGMNSPFTRAGLLPGILSRRPTGSDAGACLDPADWVLLHRSTPKPQHTTGDSRMFHFTTHRLTIVRAARVEDEDEGDGE